MGGSKLTAPVADGQSPASSSGPGHARSDRAVDSQITSPLPSKVAFVRVRGAA